MKDPRPLTIVVKLGTSSICDEKTHEPLLSNLALLVETCVRLRRDGHRVIVVSSGAIGIGLRRLDLEKRPRSLAAVQALAAVGQCRLIALWDELFKQLRQPIAQVLLTRNDIADRTQYLNAANTFVELLNMGIIPIVNENDTIAVSEIKFGDNDTLSAITAGMVNADYLFLLTDVDCLYTNNPRTDPTAKPIEVVEDISTLNVDVSSAGSSLGTGGMSTKITAARLATSAGVTTIIMNSANPSNIFTILQHIQYLKRSGSSATSPQLNPTLPSSDDAIDFSTPHLLPPRVKTPRPTTPKPTLNRSATSTTNIASITTMGPAPLHTRFLPKQRAIRDRYFWILHGLTPHGTLYIDEGAYAALTRVSKSALLPVGVVHVEGNFAQQEAVKLVVVKRTTTTTPTTAVTTSEGSTEDSRGSFELVGPEVGRALVNYSSVEIARIKGLNSSKIRELLGYADSEYIAHRDNIAFFEKI